MFLKRASFHEIKRRSATKIFHDYPQHCILCTNSTLAAERWQWQIHNSWLILAILSNTNKINPSIYSRAGLSLFTIWQGWQISANVSLNYLAETRVGNKSLDIHPITGYINDDEFAAIRSVGRITGRSVVKSVT